MLNSIRKKWKLGKIRRMLAEHAGLDQLDLQELHYRLKCLDGFDLLIQLEMLELLERLNQWDQLDLQELHESLNFLEVLDQGERQSVLEYLNRKGTSKKHRCLRHRAPQIIFPNVERWVISLSFWIPRPHRESLVGDLLEDCKELRQLHCWEWRIRIHVLWQFAICVVTLLPEALISKFIPSLSRKSDVPKDEK